MSRLSRLLIDPNRGEDDPTLIMKISDGAIISGNHPITPEEWENRLDRFHRPYHRAVSETIARVGAASGKAPLVISLHSYTHASPAAGRDAAQRTSRSSDSCWLSLRTWVLATC